MSQSTTTEQKKEETKGVMEGACDTLSDAAATVKDKISHGVEATKAKFGQKEAETSKESNWETAKDSDKSIGERVSGAAQTARDTIDEKTSASKYEAEKEATKQ